jgi:hypothetical protein
MFRSRDRGFTSSGRRDEKFHRDGISTGHAPTREPISENTDAM